MSGGFEHDLSEERRCRSCGCTEFTACVVDEDTGETCRWVEWDLCSACLPPLPRPGFGDGYVPVLAVSIVALRAAEARPGRRLPVGHRWSTSS
jgi:hypothetical protein